MKDSTGAPIVNASLWELIFGGGGAAGDPNTMYITAGLANEQHGLFASIVPNAATPPTTADFSISAPTTATVRVGQNTTLAVTINALNGFNSEVQFSCSGEPANSICTFTPATVTPAAGGMVSTSLKISTRTAGGPYGMIARLPNNSTRLTGLVVAISLLFICGVILLSVRSANIFNKTKAVRFAFSGVASLVLLGVSLVALAGCGGNNSSSGGATPPGTTTLVITAKSGALSHSTNVALTIN
jgi:hypothetical protein